MVCDCEEEITVVRLLSNDCKYSVFLLAVLWVDEWSVIVKKRYLLCACCQMAVSILYSLLQCCGLMSGL